MTDNICSYGYRTPRFRVEFRLFLQIDDRYPALVAAYCSDLSESGLAAEVKESIEIGAKVTLILTLPGTSAPMRVAANVIHRQGECYGFAFVFSSQSQQTYVREYLESSRSRRGQSQDLPD